MTKPTTPTVELSFEELIAPVKPEEFYEKYWDRQYLYIARNDPFFYGSLFSVADIDRCIYSARMSNQDNLNIIPPPDSDRKIQRYLPGAPSMDKIYNALHAGNTVRLMAVQASWPPVAVLAASLSEAFSANANVNFYLTPAESQGFPIHLDTHDVFILQVEGSKNWYVYEADFELPTYTLGHHLDDMKARVHSPLAEDEARLVEKIKLEQGDLLYMPRGVPHKAVTAGEPSLHLTVGVHPLHWVDFAKAAMEKLCLDHVELRRSLPPGFAKNPDQAGEMAATFAAMLHEMLDGASFEDTAQLFVEQQVTQRRFPPDGHLERVLKLDQITPETLLVRRKGLDCLVDSDDKNARIRFGSNHVQGPLSIAAALEFIRDNIRFRVHELPGRLGEKSKLVLARRLIREGLLKPVAEEVGPAAEKAVAAAVVA